MSGAASVTYNVVNHFGGQVLLVQMAGTARPPAKRDSIEIVTLYWPENRILRLLHLPKQIHSITLLLRRQGVELIVLEGASWVLYHWLLMSMIKFRFAKCSIIYHSHNVEYDLRVQKHSHLISRLTKFSESRVLKGADFCTAVSKYDQMRFSNYYGVRPYILPNGVDVSSILRLPPEIRKNIKSSYGLRDKAIIFMGDYAYLPNRQAIDFLVNKVMPLVLKNLPEAQLVITGGLQPYHAPWLINPGRLPFKDLCELICAFEIGVAPIFSGSGTRLKILEYMAAGIPVVASPKGIEGIEAVDGEHFLCASTADEFHHLIVEVLTDGNKFEPMSERARDLVHSRYSWKVILKNFKNYLTTYLVSIHKSANEAVGGEKSDDQEIDQA